MNLFEEKSLLRERLGYNFLLFLIVALFCIFAVRLWYLQVYKAEYFFEKAQDNVQRRQLVYAPRGLFLDREGRLLAVNEPSYSLALVREDTPDIDRTLKQVSRWTNIPLEKLRDEFERGRTMVRSFEKQVLVSNLSYELLTRVETEVPYWPGVRVMVQPRRKYLQGEVFSHVLGYVAQASEEELRKDPGLRLGDNVGKHGLELTMEQTLRGTKGLKQQEVDAAGRVLREQILQYPESGQDVQLSIDLDLQEHIYSRMQGKTGAVVVLDADTGQVRALVSTPGYDNNKFVFGISHADWRDLIDDPHRPLRNRTIQNAYPPGSVLKPVMAALGLEEGFDPEEEIFCRARYRLGNRVFRCWHHHGDVDMNKALVQSCDTYFYKLARKLGVDKMSPFAKNSGLGKPTGINLPHERAGIIPDREWKLRNVGEAWRGGDNLNMVIGQGFLQTTPLQMAVFTAALANGGTLYRPSLLLEEKRLDPEPLPWQEKTLDFIYQAMVDTVEKERGTARRLQTRDAEVGGKTGTAQVVRLMPEHEEDELEAVDYWFRHHGWMISFARQGDENYAVATLVEHGGSGSRSAGPVVKSIYDYLFTPEKVVTEALP